MFDLSLQITKKRKCSKIIIERIGTFIPILESCTNIKPIDDEYINVPSVYELQSHRTFTNFLKKWFISAMMSTSMMNTCNMGGGIGQPEIELE